MVARPGIPAPFPVPLECTSLQAEEVLISGSEKQAPPGVPGTLVCSGDECVGAS